MFNFDVINLLSFQIIEPLPLTAPPHGQHRPQAPRAPHTPALGKLALCFYSFPGVGGENEDLRRLTGGPLPAAHCERGFLQAEELTHDHMPHRNLCLVSGRDNGAAASSLGCPLQSLTSLRQCELGLPPQHPVSPPPAGPGPPPGARCPPLPPSLPAAMAAPSPPWTPPWEPAFLAWAAGPPLQALPAHHPALSPPLQTPKGHAQATAPHHFLREASPDPPGSGALPSQALHRLHPAQGRHLASIC